MQKIQENINNYFKNTTLHGFSYISSSRTFVERIFWVLTIFCSTICCLLLFHQLIRKVSNNPIIIVQPDIATHIRTIPFPAISFCASTSPFDTYETFLQPLIENNATYPDDIKSCFNKNYCNVKNDTNIDYLHYLRTWKFLEITWMKKIEILSNLTISPYGWCKSFNVVNDDEMFYENSTADYFRFKIRHESGYKSDLIENTQKPPFYAIGKGTGFSGEIRGKMMGYGGCSFNKACGAQYLQISVVIHSPYEMPDSRHRKIVMGSQDFLKMVVEPQIKITDESLLELDVDERECYKENEIQLKFFKTYTAINCLRECESLYILNKCGCVPFYFINNDTSLICSIPKLQCFDKEYLKFDDSKCKCYPPCEDLDYDIFAQTIDLTSNNPSTYTRTVAIFKDDSFYPQIKRKYFTLIDWLSFIGGILGLFFGFSFLSAFEVLFHVWKGVIGNKLIIQWRCLSKIKKFRIAKKSRKYFKEFMENSSIHGLTYICDEKVKIYERIAWAIIFILSIISCMFMIKQLEYKFKIDSIIIIPDNKPTNIRDIPFPAISVLTLYFFDINAQFDSYATYKIVDGKLTFDEDLVHELLRHIAISSYSSKFKFKLQEKFSHNLTNYGHKLVPLMRKYSGRDIRKQLEIIWDEKFSVQTAFLLTSIAFGYSFNIAPSEEIFNLESISDDFHFSFDHYFKGGYLNKTDKYPWNSPQRNDYILDMRVNRIVFPPTLFVLHPFEYPIQLHRDEITPLIFTMEKTVNILIVPEMIKTTGDFGSLELDRRMCFMDDERKLKFFKTYTQRNCEIECLSEKLLKICGCIPFDVVRANDSKVCEFYDYLCVEQIKSDILYNDEYAKICNCLQPCNFVSYSFEYHEIKHPTYTYDGFMKFKFKENEFVGMQRIRQIIIFDFLSYIGGLLGLFAGISVLSLFEIFYFCTLRLTCEILIMKKKKRRIGQAISIVVTPADE